MKKFEHFIGKGNNEIRRGPHTSCYFYVCVFFSGGEPCQSDYYFSERVLTQDEIDAFEAEMKLENPQCDDVCLDIDHEHPIITYVWAALDDD